MKRKMLYLFLTGILFICLTGCGIRKINSSHLNVHRTMIVFLEDDISSEEIEKLVEDIKQINNITDVRVKSKEESANEMIEDSATFKEIFDELENNPLSDSILVTLNPTADMKTIANKIEEFKGVQTVKY